MRISEISQISTEEYIRTLATWHTLVDPQFQCKATEDKYRKRKDADTVIEFERKRKGCGVISKEVKLEIDGINYHSCLCHDNFKDHAINDSLFLHKQFDKGTLAYSGGLLDQPAKYVELMMLFSRLKDEYQEEMNKETNNGK